MRKETERNLETAVNDNPALPAYFLSMKIANYRCFGPEQVLDLSRGEGIPAQWTIILGDNGVGKTTLLQCLAAARIRKIEGFNDDNTALYVISSEGINTFDQSFLSYSSLKDAPFYIEYNFGYGANIQNRSACILQNNISFKSDKKIRGYLHGTRTNSDGLVSYGYGANRRLGKVSMSESRSENATASLFSDDVELLNAEEWLLQADYAARRSSASRKTRAQLDSVQNILISLLPEVDEIRFVESPEDGRINIPLVEFKTPYGWVPLKGLSLGYRTLITWMVDLASRLFERYPGSPNPLAEPAIVLVDEIDLHLHPRWQRTLMQFLTDKFPNTQFIVTAHSPLVVQSAVGANIVLLRREGDHVVIDNDVETIKNWRVDQILTSELFGLESARPVQTDAAMAERNKILSKARLTKADEKRLEELEQEIGHLPTGETPEDLEAMDIIRRAAQLLKTE